LHSLSARHTASTLSEDTRNALNALLYQTGTASHSFMLVLATNRAEDLDEAVLDRMVSASIDIVTFAPSNRCNHTCGSLLEEDEIYNILREASITVLVKNGGLALT
jgi:ATPase family associated with various cellular activities (AAA)